jgi:hypothetical protein
MIEKQRTQHQFLRRAATQAQAHRGPRYDQKLIEDFRELVFQRLGPLALAILDTRLEGDEIKLLAGSERLGKPTAYLLKKTVQQIKQLAVEYGRAIGDQDFLGRVEAAAAKEVQTVARRKETATRRRAARYG